MKIQHMGLIPTKKCFFVIHTEYETEFVFSFKNSEVDSIRNVLYSSYCIDNLKT